MFASARAQPYLIAALACLTLAASAAYDLHRERAQQIDIARTQTAALARLLEEHVQQLLRRADAELQDAARQHQDAVLAHPADQPAGTRQGLAQAVGVGHRHQHVVRQLGAGGVGPVVVDQLARAVAKHPQLEPAMGHGEEGVVLVDELRVGIVAERAGQRQQGIDAGDAGLDFDIGGHGPIVGHRVGHRWCG